MPRSSLLLPFFALACLVALAQDAPQQPPADQPPSAHVPSVSGTQPLNDGTYRIGRDVTPPEAKWAPDPPYSEWARRERLVGTVTMSLVVGTDGKPKDIKLTHRLGMGLDEQAVATVMNWQFQPAQKAGVPVPVRIMVEVTFRLAPPQVPVTLDALARWTNQPPQFPGVVSRVIPWCSKFAGSPANRPRKAMS